MNKFKKILLFVFILPLTIIVDFVLFSFTRNCPSCGSFGQWLSSNSALSFPLIVMFGDWFRRIIFELHLGNKN